MPARFARIKLFWLPNHLRIPKSNGEDIVIVRLSSTKIEKRHLESPCGHICVLTFQTPLTPHKNFDLLYRQVGWRAAPVSSAHPIRERGQMSDLLQHQLCRANSAPAGMLHDMLSAQPPLQSGSDRTSTLKKYASHRATGQRQTLPYSGWFSRHRTDRPRAHGALLNDCQKTYAGRCQPPRRNTDCCN